MSSYRYALRCPHCKALMVVANLVTVNAEEE